MERSELFDLMGELQLYGMKAAFDEIMATAVKRQHEPQRVKSPGRGRWAPQRRQYVGAKWLMQRCLVARIAPLLSAALTR